MTHHKASQDESLQVSTESEIERLLKARMSLNHLISDARPLSEHDYKLIGKFIQTYCIADLEARRVINCLNHIRLGEPTKLALKLNDKDVLDHLIICANCCTWNLDLAKGIRRAAEIFVQHRQLRHLFAHWAGRRVPDHGAYIFFTTSFDKQKAPKDAIIFEEKDGANIQYCIIQVSSLVKEQIKLQEHAQYLANVASKLEIRATEIAKQFSHF